VRRSLASILAPAPLRLAGRVLNNPKEISLMSLVFLTPAAATQPTPPVMTLVVQRDQGAELRSQLESVTGLSSEAPPATE